MANIALDAGKVVLKNGKASCSCCGGGDCGSYDVSPGLKEIIESAFFVSVNGTEVAWLPAGTDISNTPPTPSALISYFSGTLYITADNGYSTSWLLPDGKTVAECPGIGFLSGPDTITVNGITLNAVNWFGDIMTPTPNIVFS